MVSCLHLMDLCRCRSKSVFIYECWSLACLSRDISDEFSGYGGHPKENLQIKVNQCELRLFKPPVPYL